MSAKGRASLSQIFASDQYKEWAAERVNAIDANKVAKAFAGDHVTKPGSNYARGLVGLCEENPPLPPLPPPPPPPVPLAEIWTHDAAFAEGGLSNFAGAARDRARQLGWTVVYVQLLHTGYAAANLTEMVLSQWNAWAKVGWGTYGQNTDPYQDGKDAAALCKAHPILRGWKANGEDWAERDGRWKTEAFLRGWQEAGAPVPLGWSVNSSDTGNYPREYDYATALSSAGADIDAQVYEADHPNYTVGACLANFAKTGPTKPEPVPVNRTTMTFSVDGNGNGPFGDYKTWGGPRRLWRPDKATPATFDALVR